MTTRKVFVYGTLKRGYWNHHLLETSEFLGDAITIDKYLFHSEGIPYMMRPTAIQVKDKNLVFHLGLVTGELFQVTEQTVLSSLDRLEGHPSMYRRQDLQVLSGGNVTKCEGYFYQHTITFDKVNENGVHTYGN